MLQLFVNGPPGAGKTSLCRLLCDEFGLEMVATGDLLRENILMKTPLGVAAKDCIARKSLVPDHVVVDMVAEKICACVQQQGNRGWVLDGFPRTPEQSAALRRKHIFPSVVIVLELSEADCVRRITGRRFDPATSKIYHLPTIMPRDAGVLARLTKRSDDSADKLPPRFAAYAQHGDATNATYAGVVHRIDAARKQPQELLEEVAQLLHTLRPGSSTTTGGSHTLNPGNQAMAPPPVIPIRHAAPAAIAQAAVPVKRPSKHQVPQKIDEEDEEQVAQEEQAAGIEYDLDELKFAERRGSIASSQAAGSRRGSACSSASNSEAEAPPSFQAMHLAMAPNMDAGKSSRTLATAMQPETASVPAASQSNNSSPSASPPHSPVGPSVLRAVPPPSATGGVDMAKFKDMLLDGFDVLKHGRRGSPHARTIFTDMEFKRIFWMKPGKEAKAKKAKLDQSLLMADIVQVLRGMKTEVLKRSGDVSKYERYLSLVADDRTLDLELPSEAMCEFLLRGFEQLVLGSS